MIPARIAEITIYAHMAAERKKAGQPVYCVIYLSQEDADLYNRIFEQALKEGKK